MKKLICLCFVMFIFVSLSTIVKAHPGRTDANGCHVCRTNCEKWGLKNGEYHCHNGGKSSGNSSSTQKKATHAPAQHKPAVPAQPKIDYQAAGTKDGYTFKMQNPNKDMQDANFAYSVAAYKEAYQMAYEKAERELQEKTIFAAKKHGAEDAKKLENYKLTSLPDGVITNVYEEYYKKAFSDMGNSIKKSIKADANTSAYDMVFQNKEVQKPMVYNLKKYENVYSTEFAKQMNTYKRQKTDILQKAVQNGKADAKNGKAEDLQFLETYKNTHFYDEAKTIYVKNYEENKHNGGNILLGGITIFVIFLGIILCMRRKKRIG